MLIYIAIVRQVSDNWHTVYFPDFPECIVSAADHLDAWSRAKKRITAYTDWLLKEGKTLPVPMRAVDALRNLTEDELNKVIIRLFDMPLKEQPTNGRRERRIAALVEQAKRLDAAQEYLDNLPAKCLATPEEQEQIYASWKGK